GSARRGKSAANPSVLVGGVGPRLDHALAAIEAIGRDAVTQVRLAGLWVDRQRGLGDRIVRAVHAPLGGSLATLLDWHWCSLLTQLFDRPDFSRSPRAANGRCVGSAGSSFSGTATSPGHCPSGCRGAGGKASSNSSSISSASRSRPSGASAVS